MAKRRRHHSRVPITAGPPAQSIYIQALPTEVLLNVFGFLSYQQVAETLRLVSRRFAAVATLRLNLAVTSLKRRLRKKVQQLSRALRAARGRRHMILLNRAHAAVAMVRSQVNLLHAVTWRYICPLRPGMQPRACFYGGRVLDGATHVLQQASVNVGSLGTSFFRRDQQGTSPRTRISDLAKRFMNHFEKVTERKILTRPSDSGAKLVDLLNCLVDPDCRTLDGEVRLDPDTGQYNFDSTYVLRRSWFVRLSCHGATRMKYDWRDDLYYMHMRIRRLVWTHNHHHLQYSLRSNGAVINKQPSPVAAVYTGYGFIGRDFFCYGTMNRTALRHRVHRPEGGGDEDEEEHEEISANEGNSVNLYIRAQLTCSSQSLPFTLHKQNTTFEQQTTDSSVKLTLDFFSPENERNQLPASYQWKFPSDSMEGSEEDT